VSVITRNKFKKIITPDQIKRFVSFVLLHSYQIKIKTPILSSRDVKDNFLLSMSIDGNIDYLITGDLDLLVLKEI